MYINTSTFWTSWCSISFIHECIRVIPCHPSQSLRCQCRPLQPGRACEGRQGRLSRNSTSTMRMCNSSSWMHIHCTQKRMQDNESTPLRNKWSTMEYPKAQHMSASHCPHFLCVFAHLTSRSLVLPLLYKIQVSIQNQKPDSVSCKHSDRPTRFPASTSAHSCRVIQRNSGVANQLLM